MTFSGIQLVTFDMDGTLIDDEWAHEQAKTEIARTLGVKGDLHLSEFTGRSNRKFWQFILETFQVNGDIEDLTNRQFKRVLELVKEHHYPESAGLKDALNYLRSLGIKTAITSGSDVFFVDDILDYLNLTELFDIKVSKEYVKEVKPSPDIYLKALELAGTAGKDAVGIEDSNSGCTALHGAGMKCIGYTNQGKNPQSLLEADCKIQSMLELISLIRR